MRKHTRCGAWMASEQQSIDEVPVRRDLSAGAVSLLSFSDAEMNWISVLASGLPAPLRGAFLQMIAANLAGHPAGARDSGLVFRVASAAQKHLLKAGPAPAPSG